MRFRSLVLAAGAAALLIGTAACSSDSSSGASGSDTASASATSSAAAAAPAPTAEELQKPLSTFVDTNASESDKEAAIADGQKIAPAITALSTALNGYGQITFAVSQIKQDGGTATANVVANTPHGAGPIQGVSWAYQDGQWKLSSATACSLAGAYAHYTAPCPA